MATCARHACDCARPANCIDTVPGRYLATLYVHAPADGEYVAPGVVSHALDVRPSSVTEMFGRLAAAGYVEYAKHDGARLRPDGRRIARTLVHRQRTVERFFERTTGTSIDPAVAFDLGHAMSATTLSRLAGATG